MDAILEAGLPGMYITEDYEYGTIGSNFGNGRIIFVPFCSGGVMLLLPLLRLPLLRDDKTVKS
jgi:hypothetical protein